MSLSGSCPPGRWLNVSRGALVDEDALADALDTGRLVGAALDVLEQEPLPPDSRLRGIGGCIFGSHNASNTDQGVRRASERAVDNLILGLTHRRDVWHRGARDAGGRPSEAEPIVMAGLAEPSTPFRAPLRSGSAAR